MVNNEAARLRNLLSGIIQENVSDQLKNNINVGKFGGEAEVELAVRDY